MNDECVLLINPGELLLLGLVLAPHAQRYVAIGEPKWPWHALAAFLVAALDDLATNDPSGACIGEIEVACADTIAVRSVEASPEQILIQLEWCGLERELVYFLRDLGDEWPGTVGNVNIAIDVGPQSPALGTFANHLAPTLAPKAVLLAPADDYDEGWHPFFPDVEKPPPPKPSAVAELWGTPVFRFEALRALLEPEVHQVIHEVLSHEDVTSQEPRGPSGDTRAVNSPTTHQ